MKLRTLALAAALVSSGWMGSAALAQGFVFGTSEPKADAPATAPATHSAGRNAKVESAQRLLARMGLFREAPSGNLTPATLEAIRVFSAQHGLAPTNQVTDALLNAIRKTIWQTQNWSAGNYKGREKIVDAAGLREAQILLGKLGYNAGPLDGTFGPQTQVATEAFQESQAVSVDGLITATVLMNLRRAANGVGSSAKDTVRVLNWPDYIEPSVLQDFEKEFKVRVVYDIFASNDDLQAKLRGGGTPYDVVFPTANAVPAMAAKGLLGKLDKASLKNIANIDPRVDATLRTWDKDGAYSLPYMWYTVGIAWNPKLTARAYPGREMDSLANVFDPEVAKRFQSCGIGLEALPGIDVQAGLRVMAGNQAFYLRMLRKFAASERDFAQRFQATQDAGDAATLARQAHTLKGLAGNIGAHELYAAADRLESASAAGPQDTPELARLLATTVEALDQVLASIASLGHPDQPAAAQATVLSELERAQARALLLQLAPLVDNNDAEAMEVGGHCVDLLKRSTLAPLVLPLERALRDFDFERAAELLPPLQSALN